MAGIRVGLIGCGRISDLHARAYGEIEGAEIYAVCDTDRTLAEAKMKEWGACRCFIDYRDMLADPGLDAVEILTPQDSHEAIALDAVEAGLPTALQKPMTVDLASADRIVEAVRESSVRFRITDNYIFYPPVVFAKKLLDNGEIGDPTNIRIKMISSDAGGWTVPPAAWEWRRAEALKGRGMQTYDHGHHLWAAARYLLGESEKVVAWIDSIDGSIDSPAVIMWKYCSGVRYGMCEYVHARDAVIPSNYYANDEWFEISGTKGVICINRCTGHLKEGPVVSVFSGSSWKHYDDIPSDWYQGFRGAAENFVSLVRGETVPMLSAEEGRAVLEFALAVGTSAREGREVRLGGGV
ncbi:MAG: Gfo/Idh/MocA family oxidoreductase [Spirochaetales bacterium]|nr:Gfo/Idh/MocA family oxidoreductase [Spirochaetales bacterium]